MKVFSLIILVDAYVHDIVSKLEKDIKFNLVYIGEGHIENKSSKL